MNKRYAFFLLSFFLLAYIIPLGARDLAVPDETRYAEIPREMISSGDWITPRLNGLRYFEKPVLGYWIYAGSLLLFGENEFAVRLPSALATGLTALLIFALVYRTRRKETSESSFPAILAVLVYLSSFEVFGIGNAAVLDSLFSFFLTASILTFYVASEEPQRSFQKTVFLLLSGISCGLAFLTKGFLAFALPVLALAPYLAWQRRYSDILRMSWLPVLVAVMVALPWSVAIHLREPDFWQFFFWNEHIHRFVSNNAQHKESFWFFFMMAPAMFVPWTFMVPTAITGIRNRIREQTPQGKLIRFSICWFALPFLFFSVSNGKLVTYILPCFPPLAVLFAFGLLQVLEKNGGKRLFQGGIVACAVLFGLILIAFLYVQLSDFNGLRPFIRPWKVVLVVDAFAFFGLFLFWAFRSGIGKEKALIFGSAPLLLFFVAHYTIPDVTIESKSPGRILEQQKKDIADSDVIISDKDSIRAVCWYLKRSDIHILGRPGEFNYALNWKDAGGRFLDMRAAVDLIKQNPGKTVLITRVRTISQWQDMLPKPVSQEQSGSSGYAIWKY